MKAFLSAVLAIGLLLSHPTSSHAQAPWIHSGGQCVTTDSTNVITAACKANDTTQKWFWAPGNKLRSFRFPHRCLQVAGGTFTRMTPVVLQPCVNASYQQWIKSSTSAPSGRLRAGSSSLCLTVSGGRYLAGRPLVVFPCQQSVAQTWGWSRVATMTNEMAAGHAFPSFLTCKTEGASKCKLTPDLAIRPADCPNAIIRWAYGFHTGGCWGPGSLRGETLDFGDQYSLDRCARSHDAEHWSKSDGWVNNAGFRACLDRVTPGTTTEQTALNDARSDYDGKLRAECCFAVATRHSRGTGLLRTDCPRGQFWDPNGYCYTCPAGYNRTAYAVSSDKACRTTSIPLILKHYGATGELLPR